MMDDDFWSEAKSRPLGKMPGEMMVDARVLVARVVVGIPPPLWWKVVNAVERFLAGES